MRRGTLRSFVGTTAAVLIGFGSVAAIFSQSRPESARLAAWKFAQDAIEEDGTGKGVPKFIMWATSRQVFPCGEHPAASPPRISTRDLLDESFHYNPQAAVRMCQPLAPETGARPLDAAEKDWMKSEPKASSMTPPFPDGARLAGVFWNAVRRPVDPGNGKVVQMAMRSGSETSTRKIRIVLPKNLRTESVSCDPPTDGGEPATADVADVSLDEFFWVQLKPGERYNGASCGDFAVLMAFHLVHKVQGKWLWSTFWWDPESQEFGRDRPKAFDGAGPVPRAWRNYAMDATFESTGTMFNPWRIEERGDNCARCHAEVTVYKSAAAAAEIGFDSVTAARNHFQ